MSWASLKIHYGSNQYIFDFPKITEPIAKLQSSPLWIFLNKWIHIYRETPTQFETKNILNMPLGADAFSSKDILVFFE